jgi:hypothetical protein
MEKADNNRNLIKLYRVQRDQYKDHKKKLLLEIEKIKRLDEDDGINHLADKIEISRLEREIQAAMPRTNNGAKICPKCDCISLEYTGKYVCGIIFKKTKSFYHCEICGRVQRY